MRQELGGWSQKLEGGCAQKQVGDGTWRPLPHPPHYGHSGTVPSYSHNSKILDINLLIWSPCYCGHFGPVLRLTLIVKFHCKSYFI